MIIDVHTHIFPERIAKAAVSKLQAGSHTACFSDGTAAGLSARERAAGVEMAWVQPVATNPAKLSHMNDFVLQINENTGETGLLSFGAMHPASPDWEAELERLKAAKVPGIKLHPPYQGVDIDAPRSLAVLKKCRELGLMVLIHSGEDVGVPNATQADPRKIRRALDAVGGITLIAAHMGGWNQWQEAKRLLPETGVYLDTAFALGRMTPAPDDYPWREEDLRLLGEEAFCDMVAAFGADRVLFGTDSPWGDPEAEVKQIRGLPLREEEIQKILSRNAAKLLVKEM
ncbi:MAG: amidohydrolase family protein [Clostridia bacterium]|nr:amidohydrolase family protein [Clostridia bacterium]